MLPALPSLFSSVYRAIRTPGVLIPAAGSAACLTSFLSAPAKHTTYCDNKQHVSAGTYTHGRFPLGKWSKYANKPTWE